MKVSLVIPTYNSVQYIEQTLKEVIEHIPSEVTEIIMVDDSSSDETYSLLRGKEKLIPNLRLIRTDCNRGQALATILGINAAKKNYVILMDDDLQYRPSDFQLLIERAKSMEHFQVIFGHANTKSHHPLYNVFVSLSYVVLRLTIPWIGPKTPVTSHYLLNKMAFQEEGFHPIYAWEWDRQLLGHVQTTHYKSIRGSSTYNLRGHWTQFQALIQFVLSRVLMLTSLITVIIFAALDFQIVGIILSVISLIISVLLLKRISHHKKTVINWAQNELQKITAGIR